MTKKLINKGGAMRCCIDTLDEADTKDEEGEIIKCKYCEDGFVLRDDVWRKWSSNHADSPQLTTARSADKNG